MRSSSRTRKGPALRKLGALQVLRVSASTHEGIGGATHEMPAQGALRRAPATHPPERLAVLDACEHMLDEHISEGDQSVTV